MDEKPAYFDMVPSKTIDFIGTKTVNLLNHGHEKSRFSLVITVRADYFSLPIGIIFKGLRNIPKIRVFHICQ